MSMPESQRLSEQLDEVTRREAWLRVKVAQEFLALQTQVKAYREKVQALSDELGARNTYVHELHLEREERVRREHERWADLEAFAAMLHAAEDERDALRAEISAMRSSWGWKFCAPLRSLQRKLDADKKPKTVRTPDLPGGDFLYYLHTPVFRVYREPAFTLRGWAMPRDGREITALRVRLGETGIEAMARRGLEEPDVIREHGAQPKNPRPGFEVEFPTPAGRHQLRLEAQLENREWRSILSTPIWVKPR
jgi:hypothetical protein